MESTKIHGWHIYYENYDDLRSGIDHLSYDLDDEEVTTLLDAAKLDGKSYFQDKYAGDYMIVYDYHSGTYQVAKRV